MPKDLPRLEAQALLRTTEGIRLKAPEAEGWRDWGPFLSERQWGTVREDYSQGGAAWDYITHDQARSRAYRWGEDGIAGFSDRHQILVSRPWVMEWPRPNPQRAHVRS